MNNNTEGHFKRLEDAVYALSDKDLGPALESLAALRKELTRIGVPEAALREAFHFVRSPDNEGTTTDWDRYHAAILSIQSAMEHKANAGSPPAPPLEAANRESAWLVEAVNNGKSDGWYTAPPFGIGGWNTYDPLAAKRFTKQEAVAVAYALSYFRCPFRWSRWVASEHVFMAAPNPQSPEGEAQTSNGLSGVEVELRAQIASLQATLREIDGVCAKPGISSSTPRTMIIADIVRAALSSTEATEAESGSPWREYMRSDAAHEEKAVEDDAAMGDLVALLTAYFQQSFPSYPPTDPLEMVRLMGTILAQTNRQKAWTPE